MHVGSRTQKASKAQVKLMQAGVAADESQQLLLSRLPQRQSPRASPGPGQSSASPDQVQSTQMLLTVLQRCLMPEEDEQTQKCHQRLLPAATRAHLL